MGEHIHKIFKFIDPPTSIALDQCINAIDACYFPWERCLSELNSESSGLVPVVWESDPRGQYGLYSNGSGNLITLNSLYYGLNYSFTMLHEAGHMVDDTVLTNNQREALINKWHIDNDGPPNLHDEAHTHHTAFMDGGWRISSKNYLSQPSEAFADSFVACFAPSYFPYKKFAHWSDDIAGVRDIILGKPAVPTTPTVPAPKPSAFPNDSIYRLYRAVFLREPDAAGYKHWSQHQKNGATLESIANSFTKSAEFGKRYGSLNNEQFVTLLYRNVMNRAPDSGGMKTWTTALVQGRTRGYVLVGLSESTEFYQKIAAERKL